MLEVATFISKEELLAGTTREIPAAIGATPQNSPSFFAPSGGTGGLDQIERILSHLNGIVTQVNNIRQNPTTQALLKSRGGQTPPQFAEPGTKQPNLPGVPAPEDGTAPRQAQTTAPQPAQKAEINEDGVREFIDAVMEELDKSPEEIKGLTINSALLGYKMMPGQKQKFQENAILKFKEWMPRLIK